MQFTYKGDSEFTTTTGGIVSILTSILIFFYGGQQILFLFLYPDYSATTTTTYSDFTSNTDKILFDTAYETVAVKLELKGDVTPEELVRVQFQQFISEKADGNIDMNIYPAIKCNELYAS